MTTTGQATRSKGSLVRRLYAGIVLLVGVALLAGGVVLASLGGSLYYLATGLVVVGAGVLIWRGDRRGVWLYVAMLVATVGWAVWEVEFAPWLLVPRLVAPLVLGLGLLLPSIRRLPMPPARLAPAHGWPAFAGGLALAVAIGAVAHPTGAADPIWQTGTAVAAPRPLATPLAAVTGGGWQAFGNDRGGTRFSPLVEITPSNVKKLTMVWQAETGPALAAPTGGLEVTPIMVGDALYVCNGFNVVIAYDAETGRERWRYDMTGSGKISGRPCRGVSYYRVPNATGPCAERIFAASQGPDLFALDTRTGRPCPGFGSGGRVSLLDGIGPSALGLYYVSSSPQLIRGKVVVGGGVLDGQAWGDPSGVIRAYDAVSGKLAWAFDVGHPERHGAPPPGETYTRSTTNSWAPISADETLGLVYLPTGNATPDNYGGNRRPFDDAINASVIALDADTGRLRWRFQTVHHDLWDYDVPSQPTLVDLPTPGGIRKALIQPTKRGEIFVLDRVTGQPIRTVRELPVPQGDTVPGERPLSPTQPFSVGMPSLRGPLLREADMWGVTPIDQMICRIQFKRSRYEGTFTPLSLDRPTMVQPGFSGGVNWGSVSIDVDRGIMVVNWMRYPTQVTLMKRAEATAQGITPYAGSGPVDGSKAPMVNTPYGAVVSRFLSPLGVPCSAPPWGMVGAVDLASGRMIWSKPLGTAEDAGPLGIASHLPLTMGLPLSGGSITTRGGLVFIAAAAEQAIRALDVKTGAELWKARLPAGGQATPMTYRAPRSGRQFVLIAAGGKPSLKTKAGTTIVAYALPR